MTNKVSDQTVIVEWCENQETPYGKVQKGDLTETTKLEAKTFLDRGLCFIPESVSVMYLGSRALYVYKYRRKKYVFHKNLPRIVPVVVAWELKHYRQAFEVRPLGYLGIPIRPTVRLGGIVEPEKREDLKQHYTIRYNGNFGDVLRATCLAETLYKIGYTVSFKVKPKMVELFDNNPYIVSKQPEETTGLTINLDKIRVFSLEAKNVLRTNTWLKEIGLEDSAFRKPSYFPTSAELEYADGIVKKDKFSIGLSTIASVPGKTWPYFDELAKELKRNSQVIILDKMVERQFRYTLRQLGAIISKCDLVITNDSLNLHLAGAVDTPCIGLFGNTHGKCMVQSYPFCIALQGKCKIDKPPCWYSLSCGKDYFEDALPCVKAISVDTVIQTVNKMRS